ncbi:MAG: hypothetical protein BWK77_09260 [Verrucomicrobia bacterium A1]|nr:MAG: hypothetical protein BWK77_09260 [Verrucomicrobia bacterium A1]
MKKAFVNIAVATACCISSAGANEVAFPGVDGPGAVIWTLPASVSAAAPMDFSVSVTGFDAQPENGGYVLRIGGQAAPLRPGAPDVPVLARTVSGIGGYVARVRVKATEHEEFSNVVVAAAETRVPDHTNPDRPELKAVRVASDPAYAGNEFWPPAVIVVQEASMGTQKFVRIECRPIQYNPATHTVRFNREIEAQLWFESQEKP